VPSDVPLVPWAEVERHWAHRPLPESAYRARVEPLADVIGAGPGERCVVPVRVVNEGTETWPGGEQRAPLIRLGHAWPEGARTMLPGSLAPGEAVVVDAVLEAPTRRGRHELRFDLVHEDSRWFGCEGATVTLDVRG
jgi:hypothetical protein